mmetsp:Transcript_73982/g.154220  ORF Transcript_73982/g.154220 Transcript_73982/m.154220 type:complete len:426 (-) Transcript_73982:80-1357(-)
MPKDSPGPLLPIVDIPVGHLPELHIRETTWQRFKALPVLAFSRHWCGILTTVISATVCWWLGYAEVSVIDGLIFKSIFIIFGFTMGFRNVRANQRYFDAMQTSQSFFQSAWSIYTVMPRESRVFIRAPLLNSMKECCAYIHRVGKDRRFCWYGMVGLEPVAVEDEAISQKTTYGTLGMGAFRSLSSRWEQSPDGTSGGWIAPATPKAIRGHGGAASDALSDIAEDSPSAYVLAGGRAVLSPHSKLLEALLLVEGEFEKLETDKGHQRYRRHFWTLKTKLLNSYDDLLSLAFPSVTGRFLTFVDCCLFFFAVSFPWGIKVEHMSVDATGHQKYKLNINSGIILVCYTTLVVIVLFTLNAITSMNEDPLADTSDDIDLRRLMRSVALGFEAFDRQADEAKVVQDLQEELPEQPEEAPSELKTGQEAA